MKAVALDHVESGPPDAPALLLGGSLGTTLEMWDPQVEPLARDHRLIRLDHRGHGASPVPPAPYTIADLGGDVLALFDRLGVERASWCGLSLGGMVGMWLAAHAPERIDRLAVLCTSAHLPQSSIWHDRARTVREARSVAPLADAVLSRWLTPSYADAHPEEVARMRAMLEAAPPEGYAACCEAIAGMDLRADLRRIAAPTLVVAGAEDPSTPPEHGRAIADGVQDGRLVVLPDAAHLASVERPGEVARLVAEHLDGTAPTGRRSAG